MISKKFDVLTDHAALTYLTKQSHLSRRQARWLEFFQEFQINIIHVPGKKNVADYLSRVPDVDSNEIQQCNSLYTLGLQHSSDLTDLQCTADSACKLSSVVTLFEESSFLRSIE